MPQKRVVGLSIGLVALRALMNLRGTKESGTFFAIPTYGFVLCVFVMLALGALQMITGHAPVAESAAIGICSSRLPPPPWSSRSMWLPTPPSWSVPGEGYQQRTVIAQIAGACVGQQV